MADIVSKKLAEILDVDDELNKSNNSEDSVIGENPLTKQPTYSSSLITETDIESFKIVQEEIGLEDFSKIILMKTAQKAMNDHDELIDIMTKVDDSKAARLAEVAQSALSNAADAAKALMNFSMAKEKMAIEKQKLEIKSITINNLGVDSGAVIGGTQKEVLEQIKALMKSSANQLDDDPPPLVE